MKEIKIHNHAALERKHNIPEDHVIIDRDLYEKAWSVHFEIERLKAELKSAQNTIEKLERKLEEYENEQCGCCDHIV